VKWSISRFDIFIAVYLWRTVQKDETGKKSVMPDRLDISAGMTMREEVIKGKNEMGRIKTSHVKIKKIEGGSM